MPPFLCFLWGENMVERKEIEKYGCKRCCWDCGHYGKDEKCKDPWHLLASWKKELDKE